MKNPPELTALLPAALPDCLNGRLLLFGVRRMAAHGLSDAHATHALVGWFGLNFRRPLMLLRAFMAELSRVSERRIVVAPCCCSRMTATEAEIVAAIRAANRDPVAAHGRLAAVLGVRDCLGALASAQAIEQAFADLGRPFERE